MALLAFQNHKWRASSVSAHPTLTTSLVSYWDLDEASGTRADSHGSNTLADNNTVTQATGIGGSGNAAQITAANSESLSIADGSQTGLDLSGDFSLNVWAYFDSFPASNSSFSLMAKNNGTGNQRAYFLDFYNHSTAGYGLRVLVSSDGSFNTGSLSNDPFLQADWAGAATSTWFMLTGAYTASAGTVSIYVNGSLLETLSGYPTSVFNNNQPFYIGAMNTTNYQNGREQFAGVWSKVLTTQEITDLYNAGAGLPY